MAGSLIFSEAFNFIKPIYKAGAMGRIFLYQLFGLPIGVTILIVTVVAIIFVVFFNILESSFGRKIGGDSNGI